MIIFIGKFDQVDENHCNPGGSVGQGCLYNEQLRVEPAGYGLYAHTCRYIRLRLLAVNSAQYLLHATGATCHCCVRAKCRHTRFVRSAAG